MGMGMVRKPGVGDTHGSFTTFHDLLSFLLSTTLDRLRWIWYCSLMLYSDHVFFQAECGLRDDPAYCGI